MDDDGVVSGEELIWVRGLRQRNQPNSDNYLRPSRTNSYKQSRRFFFTLSVIDSLNAERIIQFIPVEFRTIYPGTTSSHGYNIAHTTRNNNSFQDNAR